MLRSHWIRSLSVFVVALCAGSSAFASGVRIVRAAGDANFATIQGAIDAAQPGETLLVGAGNYDGFELLGKPLRILAAPGATVSVKSAVRIADIASGNVLLQGIQLTPPTPSYDLAASLVLDSVAALCELRECTVIGVEPFYSSSDGSSAVQASACPKLVFVHCTLSGGDGCDDLFTYESGSDAGYGVRLTGSQAAFYESSLYGGAGGDGDEDGGKGGYAASLTNSFAFFGATTLVGGCGGIGWYGHAGSDAWGLANAVGTSAALGSTFLGGCGFGGVSHPANLVTYPGTPRKATAVGLASDQTTWNVDYVGAPGDRVWLPLSAQSGFVSKPAFKGVWSLAYPTKMLYVGTTTASGTLQLSLPTPLLAASSVDGLYFAQPYVVSASGQTYAGTPLVLDVLNRDSGPDCDGNGVNDFVDVTLQGANDADHDLVLDACAPPQSGPSWYVDASGPALANGSPSAPFRTLAQAFAHASSGHSIFVADGLYAGAENRNLNFAGRDLVVQASSALPNVVIDCQGLGRAFYVPAGSGEDSILGELNFVNGNASNLPYSVARDSGGGICVDNATPRIVGCNVENCSARFGGGIFYRGYGGGRIQDCQLLSNQAFGSGSRGGGLELFLTSVEVLRCFVYDNSADFGGGISASGADQALPPARISHTGLWQNDGRVSGGGVSMQSDGYRLELDQCVLLANTSPAGGGLSKGGASSLTLRHCTFVQNRTTGSAGALFLGKGDVDARNCVFWANDSGSAAPLVTNGPSSVLSIGYSDVQGGLAGVATQNFGVLQWAAGNIAGDPQFSDGDGPDNDPWTLFDNVYTLGPTSPCIDAGDNTAALLDVFDVDFDGNVSERVPLDAFFLPRYVDIASVPDTGVGPAPVVDLGAFERQ